MAVSENKRNSVQVDIGEQNELLGESILYIVIHLAAQYFEECPRDFGLQNSQGDTITFGGTNRLYWHPIRGFTASESHCTPDFLKRFNAVKSGEITLDEW
jgi:hypothetical protein